MNNMEKSQNKIAVDVVLLPPDEITDKAIEVNQVLLKTFDKEIVLNKENCFPHISLAMGCIKRDDIPEIDTILKDIIENFSPITLTISDIHIGVIPTGEKVSGFGIEKTKDLQLLHETVMNKLSPYFTYDVSLDMIYALPNQQAEETTTHWIKNYPKEASFEKFFPHITIGIGEVEGEACGVKFPIKFSVSKLALCHLGNYCTCGKIVLLHGLIKNNKANYGCTIIIPTYNRPNYLKRILNYYNVCGENYKIIVADSSSYESKKLNKEFISSPLNLNILHLSDYPSTINPSHKINDVLNYVDTKYCVFCADDDFITSNGIKKSIEFLEKNPDYVCAQGDYISFKFNSENKNFFWKPGYLCQKSITSSDPQKRLYLHMSNYMQTFYSVHKTKILKKSFEEVPKYTDDDRFGELLPSMLTLIYGKMKKLDVFYAARESTSDSGGRTSKKIPNFIKEGTYDKKYAEFKNCLAVHLSGNSQLDIEEAEKVVDRAWAEYFERVIKRSLAGKIDDVVTSICLPSRIDEGIRGTYRKLFRRNDYSARTTDDPPVEYLDDFNKIKKLVIHGR
jgi:glycosyltransferase domain-containing protein